MTDNQQATKRTTNSKPIPHIPLPFKEVIADVLKVKPPERTKAKHKRGKAVTVNYQRLQFAGNCLLGMFLAAAFTFCGYKATNENSNALIFFFPLAILFTLLLLWISARTRKRLADSARERYEDGQTPLGE